MSASVRNSLDKSYALFFISGIGFGHAARAIAVIRALRSTTGGSPRIIVLSCPDTINRMRPLLPPDVAYEIYCNDPPIRYSDLELDLDYLRAHLPSYLAGVSRVPNIWIPERAVILTDLVPEAVLFARNYGFPAVAVMQLDWGLFLRALGFDSGPIDDILEGALGIYPPFSFSERRGRYLETDFIVRDVVRTRKDIRRLFGVEGGPLITLTWGGSAFWRDAAGSLSRKLLKALPRGSTLLVAGAGVGSLRLPEARRDIEIKAVTEWLDFHEVIAASDLVVAKAGYGTLSETVSYGVRTVAVTVKGNPESEYLTRAMRDYVTFVRKVEEIPSAIGEALASPPPKSRFGRRGAYSVASLLINLLNSMS